jgi:ATP-dependent Clp protease ATP-binding subunit ClpC
MWQRFTERARRVILLGQEEATKMNSGHVGTEHLLLGLVREGEGAGAAVLQKMGVSAEKVRQAIASELQPQGAEIGDPTDALKNLSAAMQQLGAHFKLTCEMVRRIEEQTLHQLRVGSRSVGAEPKLTPKAKRVLELAADEARRMRHNYIGTEHLLLALFREKDEIAAGVLRKMGLYLEKVRMQLIEYLGPGEPSVEKSSSNRQYSSEQWQLIGELIQTVQMAVDALASTGKGKKDKLEVVVQKLDELKNRHQGNGAGDSSEN